MSKHSKIIRIVALVEQPDGSVELHEAGRRLGRYVPLTVQTARKRRAERTLSKDMLLVAAQIARQAGRGRAVVVLSDAQLAAGTGLSVKTVYTARVALRDAGVLAWTRKQRSGNAYRLLHSFGARQRPRKRRR